MATECTVCFPIINTSVILGRSYIEQFGAGLWNGFGGKVKGVSETIEDAAKRELLEEAWVEGELQPRGRLMLENCSGDYTIVHIFVTKKFTVRYPDRSLFKQESIVQSGGYSTEEFECKVFIRDKIPYDSMFDSDRFWLPWILDGWSVSGRISYDQGWKVNEVNIKRYKQG